MKTPLAISNLRHHRMRTLAAAAGVAFSVVLIFMQLGFLGSVESTASLLFDALEFDLVMRSANYLHLSAAGSFPRDRLYQAASSAGIQATQSLNLGLLPWHHPSRPRKRRIFSIGVDPQNCPFRTTEIHGKVGQLVQPSSVLIDRKSRAEFGPVNGKRFGDADIGEVVEVAGERVTIVGHFELGGGFASDGVMLLSQSHLDQLSRGVLARQHSLGLIRLAPGSDTNQCADQLNSMLPDDVEVLTRAEVVERERVRWTQGTSLGIIFQMGVGISFVVGTAIVYQVLSSDVAQHLREYATLKAMGYPHAALTGVVLRQAVILAVLGFVPGWLLAVGLYRITAQVALLPIQMNLVRIAVVFVLAVSICSLSGWAAARKLGSADPADLF